ncbi:MAG TPA: PASTA domain-containing protein [Terracidiphilus sp.]|nr:PASTA domain-containing protein [Terracidiphilus sp.]
MTSRWILGFFRVASLLMLLVAVALMSAIVTMHFAIHGAEVQVPALKGMTVADARSETAGLGLNLDVDNRYYSGDVAAGHILTQSPAAGTVVRREWRVRVSESLGPQKVDVPDTVGMEERVATLELRRAGLEVGATAHVPEAGASANTVLAQDPPAHAQDIEQPSVSLLVAVPDTEPPDGYVMPDLAGLPIVTAQLDLAKVGIKTAPPVYIDVPMQPVASAGAQPKLPIRPGCVMAQSPAAGARVDQTTMVTLTVAR